MNTSLTLGSLAALFCGALFGVGLTLSGMTDPANIVGFLTINENWNPQLLFVLMAAVSTAVTGFYLLSKWKKPIWGDCFGWPDKHQIDRPLIVGAIIFGIGWGLYGYCPGPALAALIYGQSHTLMFVIAMLAGMFAQRWLQPK